MREATDGCCTSFGVHGLVVNPQLECKASRTKDFPGPSLRLNLTGVLHQSP